MGKEGKGELECVTAFPAQKCIHSANLYGALSSARPCAGFGDTSVNKAGQWQGRRGLSAAMQLIEGAWGVQKRSPYKLEGET